MNPTTSVPVETLRSHKTEAICGPHAKAAEPNVGIGTLATPRAATFISLTRPSEKDPSTWRSCQASPLRLLLDVDRTKMAR